MCQVCRSDTRLLLQILTIKIESRQESRIRDLPVRIMRPSLPKEVVSNSGVEESLFERGLRAIQLGHGERKRSHGCNGLVSALTRAHKRSPSNCSQASSVS